MFGIIDGEGNIIFKDPDKRACEIEKEALERYSRMQYLEVIELEE